MPAPTPLSAALALAFGSAVLAPAWAQSEQRIEITGSAIKRVDAEGALPVTVITRQDIARSGATNTEELVNSISAASSMNAVNNASGAGSSTQGRSTLSLRGLQGNRTLVLVNGRRLAEAIGGNAGGAVNINNIPLAAIERVEVLKDGASSIYGSDALAGVVNFILAKNFQGIDLGVAGGKPTRSGGGNTSKGTVVAGWGDVDRDRFNVSASFSAERESQLFAKDRNFAKTGNIIPWLTAAATGQGNIEGAYTPGSTVGGVWHEGTRQPGFGNSPGTGYGNPMAAPDQCAQINMFLNPTPTGKNTPYCTYDSNAFVGLTPERSATNFTLNGSWRPSDSVELFTDVLRTQSISTQRFQQSPVRRSFLITDDQFAAQGVDPVLLIYPANPNYAKAATFLTANGFGALVGQPLAITARVFDFGPRTQRDVTDLSRLVLGARGDAFGQSWELAYTAGKYELHGTVPDGYFSQVKYARAVQQSNEWNPWSLTQTAAFNAAIAPAKYTGSTEDGTTRSKVLDAKVQGDVMQMPAGALAYAAGLQLRDEAYQSRPSDALFSGDIAGLGGATAPVDRTRKISSLFGELVIPVLKNLEGNVAARHDRYNDVGNADTYKASLRWQPLKQLVLRGGAGSGFRAPTLVELWTPPTLGSSAQYTDPAFPNNPNVQSNEITGGNPALKPETSRQETLGLVFSPFDALTVSVDYWRLKLERIITAPSTQEIVSRYRAGDPAYAGLVTLAPSGEVEQTIAVNQNVGSAKLEGVDLDARMRFALAGGRLDAQLTGTYFIKYDQVSPGGSLSHKVGTMVEETLDANGQPTTQPVLDATGGGVVLRWRHRLSGTYSLGGWAFTLAQNYYSGYRTNNRQLDAVPNFVGGQSIFDAQVAYTGFKGLTVTLGVKNLLDRNPPLYVPASNQFQAGYDISLYDPRARFAYGSVSYRF
jgi:iron complex outermembrane receptor protein